MRALKSGEQTALVVVCCFVVAVAAALGLISITTPPPKTPGPPLTAPPAATPFVWPGKIRPATVTAADAKLPDDELVIGVVAHGKARAYRRNAFAGLTNHVVNDVLGETPVTVTHCDRNGCSRVFTGEGKEPLKFMTGGFTDQMLLYVDGIFYEQDSGRKMHDPDGAILPYQRFGFEETTWAKWRAAHPDTDVYLGSPSVGPTGPTGPKDKE
jgi:Protein of unknown function (DUF3179)